jgi:uncharacterized protein YbjT (DUF2867 family)
MRVALFGGTGFVGSYLVDALVGHGCEAVLLVRPGSEAKVLCDDAVRRVSGSVADESAIAAVLEGADVAIYNIGLLRESPARGVTFHDLHFVAARRVINLAVRSMVKRFVLISANGVGPEGTSYQRSKYMAEEYLKMTRLEWTILRPSVIFGDPRGRTEFATRLYRDVVSSPLPAPLFFQGLVPGRAGNFSFSPVHAQDVAAVLVESLDDAGMLRSIQTVGGPESLSWKEILIRIADATGKTLFALPVPVWGVRAAAALLDRFALFPVTRDQLDMLTAGNTCDSSQLFERYQLRPRRFDSSSLSYLAPGRGATVTVAS